MMTANLWATKGEIVTCVLGHPICDVARDIHVGDGRSSGDFTNWHQPQPSPSTSLADIRCTICRAVWVRPDGMTYHFENGWR